MKKLIVLIALVFTTLSYSQAEYEKIAITANGVSSSTTKINTQETNGEINYINATSLPVSTATTNALELETDVSAGAITGFALTNNGNGTVNIASGTAFLRTTNDPYAQIIKYPISAVTNLALTDNANNFVLVDYNSGSPTLTVTTNSSTINTQTNSLAYVISRVGTTLDYLSLVGQNVDPNAKLRVRFLNQEGVRRASGAVLGFSSRNLTLTSSVLFSGLIRVNAVAFNTASPDTFTLAYNNGSTWTRTTGQTQINNTQYNVSGTLTTMPNNDYRTDYVYLLPNNPSKLYVIMGTATYNSLTLAKAAPRPSALPVELQVLGLEVGRLFIQKNSAAIAEVQSSFANDFIGASVPEHNALTGLQGGLAGEYNHLTNAQVSLVNGSEQTTNKATDFTTVNNTLYPTVQAVKTYADGLVVGLLDDRGTYNASSNLFPTTGGSGTSGAILKGDIWYVGTAGTLGGKSVAIGDSFRALVDTPGQTSGNWALLSSNLSYVPANDANVVHLAGTETITGNKTTSGTLTSTGGIILDSGLTSSSSGAVISTSSSGASHVYINSKNNSFGARLLTTSIATSIKDFTFPNTSGTFALTSDLSGYVALTGNQTINGNKTFTGQTAIANSSGGDGILLTTSSTGRGIRLNSVTGSTTDVLQFMRNGTETGKIDYLGNITAPSFIKSGATAGNILLAGGTDIAQSTFATATGGAGYIQNQNASAQSANMWINGRIQTDLGSGGMSLSGNSTPDEGFVGYNYTNITGTETNGQSARDSWRLKFKNGGGSIFGIDYRGANAGAGTFTNYFNISNVGAATFASTVTASNGTLIAGTLTSGYLPKATGANSLGDSIISESGNTIAIQGTGNTAINIQTNTSGSPSIMLTAAGSDVADITYDRASSQLRLSNSGATNAFALASTGNTLMGTTTDDGVNKLQVNGSVRISSLSGTGTRTVVADASGNLSATSLPPARPYLVYVALMSQSGTSAPTATVLENTLGGTVVWTRTGSGSYVGTLAGVFTTNKTVIFVNNSDAAFGYGVTLNTGDGTIHWENGADGRMNNNGTMIEIRVYP